MAEGRILHGARDGVHVLRFLGDIRYPLAPALEQFVDRLFADGNVRGFVLDLAETSSIDSTGLGAIARIANRLRAMDAPRATVVCAGEDIDEILTSMGFRGVFDFARVASNGTAHATDVVEPGSPAPDTVARTMLDAHRALMELDDRNIEKFRDVVALLEGEVGAGRQPG